MIAKRVAPSRVMLVRRNAPGGTSPWSFPLPPATFPVGFQLIGQNGLLVAGSMLKADLFLSTIGAGSSACLFLTSAGAACSAGLLGETAGAGFCSAAIKNDAARIDIELSAINFFIVFQSRWSRRLRLVEIAAAPEA